MTKKKLQWERHTVAEDEISRLERETAKIETAEQAKEAAELSARDDFWQTILAYAEECDEVLAEHGFPPAGQGVAHDGAGNWWLATGRDQRIIRGADFTKDYVANFSDAWFAADIGLKCRLALKHLENGAAGEPFHYALLFEIASRRKDWQWRRRDKDNILAGRKSRKVLAENRDAATAKKKSEVEARREAIRAMLHDTTRTGGALEQYLKRRLDNEHDIRAGLRTIRRDLTEIRSG